ncbi:MAG: dihydroneopterin aldolase [Pseudomonadota bacterium]
MLTEAPSAQKAAENELAKTIVETRRTVFLRGLAVDASIGAYDHEFEAPQPILIDIDLDVASPNGPVDDDLGEVVCYDRISKGVIAIIDEGHVKLVETLAERIAAFALAHPKALAVRVRVEKPNAVETAAGAGVELRREKIS